MLLHTHTPSSLALSHAFPARKSNRSSSQSHTLRLATDSPLPLTTPAHSGVVSASASAKPSARATAAPSTADGAGGGRDFFESDVVRYGDRYNRPDRFPRLRRADAKQRQVDVRDWLQRLRASARDVFIWDEKWDSSEGASQVENHDRDTNEGAAEREDAGAAAAAFRLLVAQGRLDEAFHAAREAMRKGRAAFAFDPVALLEPVSSSGAAAADHGAFMLAAVEGGNVELAFEYAGLLPPNPSPPSSSPSSSSSSPAVPLPRAAMAIYNVVLAAYAVAGDSSAMHLAVNTARRRGFAPDGLTSALLLAAALLHGGDVSGVSGV
ncbi:unnamed protein product [Closterium sp. Yama58-4]|nr:unnamed protein product [Closterium sp. Yama58-4]